MHRRAHAGHGAQHGPAAPRDPRRDARPRSAPTASSCTGAQPHLGYLHRCAEKIGENVEWLQYLPYTDRYDYLAAMNNNLGYSMAVEALMGASRSPPRAMMLRVICAELNRIGSHLIAFGTYGLDLGAFTPFLYASASASG